MQIVSTLLGRIPAVVGPATKELALNVNVSGQKVSSDATLGFDVAIYCTEWESQLLTVELFFLYPCHLNESLI